MSGARAPGRVPSRRHRRLQRPPKPAAEVGARTCPSTPKARARPYARAPPGGPPRDIRDPGGTSRAIGPAQAREPPRRERGRSTRVARGGRAAPAGRGASAALPVRFRDGPVARAARRPAARFAPAAGGGPGAPLARQWARRAALLAASRAPRNLCGVRAAPRARLSELSFREAREKNPISRWSTGGVVREWAGGEQIGCFNLAHFGA